MQAAPLDYANYLDPSTFSARFGQNFEADTALYDNPLGIRIKWRDASHSGVQEMVQLADGAFLLTSVAQQGSAYHRQRSAKGSDWIHIQFRVQGGGYDELLGGEVLDIPERTCIVSRYPEDSVIGHFMKNADSARMACLLMRPSALTSLLEIWTSQVEPGLQWLADPGQLQAQNRQLQLSPAMCFAVDEVINCSIDGPVRRAFMRGKSLELLSMVLHQLSRPHDGPGRPQARLSPGDMKRVEMARKIMEDDLDSSIPLADLARRVGLNRTKLALAFKQVYGTSVQACWRDLKLDHARELLVCNGLSVTEVAFRVGYSEVSSFTRAYFRKFGVLPKECRRH